MNLRSVSSWVLGVAVCTGASLASAQSAPDTSIAGRSTADYDQVRVRGGFSFNGGYAAGAAHGPVSSVSGRLGAQFNRYFGLYYQNAPTLFFVMNNDAISTGFIDQNSLLASVTLGDVFEIALGPTLDYLAVGGCGSEGEAVSCGGVAGLRFGGHGRLALNLGGRDPLGGRRGGFSIGLDAHPLYTDAGPVVLTTLGIGGEWH